MEQRLEFVREYATGLFTMTELAAQYEISRKTGYKWVAAYATGGAPALQDRSRRPHHSSHAIASELVDAILAVRRRHPRWGPKKLLAVAARRDPVAVWPARSTVAAWLKSRGLITPGYRVHHRPRATGARLAPPTRPNEVWTTDFKGEFRTGDGAYCYPLTLRDGFSRFVLRCDALAGPSTAATRRRFERAFAQYGLPDRIRSDNGGPFAGPGLGGLSRLSVWWMRLGITVERTAPGHPEQNGSHEQFHSVLKAATVRPPAANGAAQQRRFRDFVREYNEERPHEALDDQPPATRYEPSPRPLPRRLPPLEYPGHMEVRLVSTTGCISWRGLQVFLAAPLAGEPVAFEEVADGVWTVRFADVALARYDERHRTFQPIHLAVTAGRSGSSAASAPDSKNEKRP
jgi:transposase InsO family protein